MNWEWDQESEECVQTLEPTDEMINESTEKGTKMNTEKLTGLALLRTPFPEHQISKLPKPTKAQTDDIKADFKKGIRCTVCGGWHHKDVIHLDYVGHAALTDRLLDCDPHWDWQPMGVIDGLPLRDGLGGLWIKLTVCGVTRLGYGNAEGKTGGDAVKEIIGDALRNAAMRFGAALDLWHKGDLHIESGEVIGKELTDEEKRKIVHDEFYKNHKASVIAIKNAIAKDDSYSAAEAWRELDESVQRGLWIAPSKGGCFTTAERDYLKNNLSKVE